VATALVSSSFPIIHCFKWGQVSVLLTVACLVALTTTGLRGSLLLSAAACFKLYPLAYLACLRRRDLSLFVLIVLCAFVTLNGVLPTAILGSEGTELFWQRVLWAVGRGLGNDQNIEGVLTRWLYADPSWMWFDFPTRRTIRWIARVLGMALCAASLRRPRDDGSEAAWSARTVLFILAATCVLAPAWHHYFAIVPVAQSIALARLRSVLTTVLLALSLALSLVMVLALPFAPELFKPYSEFGGTFASALTAWAALYLTLHGPGEATH
jgi:hypothetical protein